MPYARFRDPPGLRKTSSEFNENVMKDVNSSSRQITVELVANGRQ